MIQRYTLSNGLNILMERLPYLRSAAVGIFVKAGSMMEEASQSGLSHFIEHMAFKGTMNRNARRIAEEIDLIGGNVNAATSKVATSYYARVTDRDLKKALELLADIVVNPKAEDSEFEKERQVILEEISMEADSPEDLVFNLAHQGLFGEQSLSRTILGGREAISAYSRKDLDAFRTAFYRPGNAVLSAAGRFEPEQFIAWAEEIFSSWQGADEKLFPTNVILDNQPLMTLDKDTEQAHLTITYPGLPSMHEDRFALNAFSTSFGGGVSSRLFQKVREEEGLVYNITAGPSFYPGVGEFTIYAACAAKKLKKVISLIDEETKRAMREGITRQEFEQTMAQIKTGYVLGMESAYQRMASMGINMLLHKRVIQQREVLANLRKVNLGAVNRVAGTILKERPKLAIVGKNISKQFVKEGSGNGQA